MKARPRLFISFKERICTLGRSRLGRLDWSVLAVVWVTTTIGLLVRQPELPFTTSDSSSYVELAPERAPAYGWFLLAFRAAGGAASFVHLPLLQAAILAIVLLVFVVQATRLLQAPLIGAAMIPLIWANSSIYEAPSFLMSEALFLPCALAGLASTLAFAQRDSLPMLAWATIWMTLAWLTRDAGVILLLVPALLVVLDGRLSVVALMGRLALILGLVVPLRLAGMAANHAVNGLFEIGSYSGVSLLGKGLLLLQPAKEHDPVLVQTAGQAAEARAAIVAAPGLASSLRAQTQAYEELRWFTFFPAAKARWAEFNVPERESKLVSSEIGGQLARRLIMADPLGYVRLVSRDWLTLVLYPHFWPLIQHSADSPHPFFAHCTDIINPWNWSAMTHQCWAFHRRTWVSGLRGLAMLGISIGGLVATFLLLVRCGGATLRRQLPGKNRAMISLALTVQATLLGTVLFEAGLWRYSIVPHVINLVLIGWMVLDLLELRRRCCTSPRSG